MNFNYINAAGTDLRYGKIIGHILILLILTALAFGSFGTVGAGERGVETRLGAVVSTKQQGAYFKIPIIEQVHIMDVHRQSLTGTLAAASNDLQDTKLEVVVNYHIDPTTVDDIYIQSGNAENYYEQVVNPLVTATIKATASQYTAAEQIQKRTEMSAKVLIALEEAFAGKNVIIEKADITDISFSPSFTQAIENKVTAVQNAEAAKNKLEQVKAEAAQTVAKAQADAEAIKIQAQAINSQGGADYVALQKVQKWDGRGCTQYCGMEASSGLLITGK